MLDYEKIKLVILDVDGTLTDGGIYYDSNGNELKRFDVKDGLGIKVAMSMGLEFAIITGRESPMVIKRANELGIQYLKTGIQKKYSAMVELIIELGLTLENVCFIGDDLNDLQCMNNVALKMCPSDAADEIKEISDYVSAKNGGYGAVRECLEVLSCKKGCWTNQAKSFYCCK